MDAEGGNAADEPQEGRRRPAILTRAWWTRKRVAIAAAAVLVVAVAAGVGVCAATAQPAPVDAAVPASRPQAHSSPSSEQVGKSAVLLTVEADGAEAGATKAKVTATGESGEVVVAEVEVEANEEARIGELPAGDYELHVTAAPVCEDGSSYRLPEKPVGFSVDGKGDARLSVKLEKLPADKMTKEQLEASAAALEEAGKPSQARSVKEKSESAASQPGSDGEVKRDPVPTPGGNSDSGSNGGGSTPAPAPAPTPEPDPTPAPHVHDWVEQTSQQWVPNNVWVEDSAAWDEPVYSYETHIICNQCGTDFGSVDAWGSHLVRGGTCVSYRSEAQQVQTGTVHHDATGHYEDQGHYETVVTGYACSCGATK